MFTIYNDGVRSFSGTLEQLYEVHPIESIGQRRPDSPDPTRTGGGAPHQGGGDSYGVTPTAISAYRNAANLTSREPVLHAHQVMRHPVVSIRADADIQDAWQQIRRYRIRQMPVQTPQVELVGLLSERELLEQLIIERDQIRHGEARIVAEVMDREVITAEPVTDVRRIARVMADRQMTAMPVVASNCELVGIVSRGDLLRAMTRTPPLRLWA